MRQNPHSIGEGDRRARPSSVPCLTVELLGTFQARRNNGESIVFSTKKAQALLAYLACRADEQQSREKLATLLWGNSGPEQARQSLRQTLFSLRRALGSDAARLIKTEGDLVLLDSSHLDLDLLHFEKLSHSSDPQDLRRATDLYKGEFLEGLLVDEESFDNWLLGERERLHEMNISVESRILDAAAEEGSLEAAVQAGFRILALDPLNESTHRKLMRLYMRLGRRESAIRQYHTCADLLRRRLGVQPQAETEKLYAEVMGGTLETDATAASSASPLPSLLMVEDNPLNRELMKAILRDAPYQITSVGDGAQALLELGRKKYDLILLDLSLPNLDGFTLISVLKENGFDVPIIVMTAHAHPDYEVRALDAGAADFMRKPIQATVLLKRIEKVLRENRRSTSL